MKILSGFQRADSGQILLNGASASIVSPASAIAHGVGMLHQDPLDFPPMRVIDNLLIGSSRTIIPRRSNAIDGLQRIQNDLDFSIDPDAYVNTLTVGERQQLELIRLLWLGADVLILDEPTTGISMNQKTKLFRALRWLVSEGKTVLFVTHKLQEAEELCDQVAILRAGKLVGEMLPPFRAADFVKKMFTKPVEIPPRQATKLGEVVLRLQGVEVEAGRLRMGPLDLEVCAGEVIGLAGMEGSGQEIFLRMCAGLIRPVAGRISLNQDELVNETYHQHMSRHMRYVPADRMKEGLIQRLSVADHFALIESTRSFFLKPSRTVDMAQERIEKFSIRGTPSTPAESLSGGNQQRMLIACLGSPISVLLVEHPTRGLDMEAGVGIWRSFMERARSDGTAILFMSADLDEILQYSDRVLVFFGGQVSNPLDARATSVEQLGKLIGGVEPE
jgi:simple sugar transport system ATP-binding protein